ncbi:MAG: Spy/CpxP family protein refolding chaperone [Ramlibacter sp.]
MTEPLHAEPTHAPRRRWLAGLAALGGLGLVAAGARAQGWGRGGRDPQEMLRRIDYRIGYMIKEVGGTPEQKDRLVAIARAVGADLQPLREQHRAARRRGLELLAAPSIDRVALEQLRVAQMQLAEAKSHRIVQALADAAEVLTPAQRTQMADRLNKRMERRRG